MIGTIKNKNTTNQSPLDQDGQAPIHLAIKDGNVSKVQELIKTNPHVVNDKNDHGVAPLSYAAKDGNIEIMKVLLDHSAKVDDPSKSGTTALMFAASKRHTEAAQLLVDRGADVSAKDKYGETALTKANRAANAIKSILPDDKSGEKIVALLTTKALETMPNPPDQSVKPVVGPKTAELSQRTQPTQPPIRS